MSKLQKLHRDERGLTVLEVVALLAVAAIILSVIKIFWNRIYKWFDEEGKTITTDWNRPPN